MNRIARWALFASILVAACETKDDGGGDGGPGAAPLPTSRGQVESIMNQVVPGLLDIFQRALSAAVENAIGLGPFTLACPAGGSLAIDADSRVTFDACALSGNAVITGGVLTATGNTAGDCTSFAVSGSINALIGGGAVRLQLSDFEGVVCGDERCYRATVRLTNGSATVQRRDPACAALLDGVGPEPDATGDTTPADTVSDTTPTETTETTGGTLGWSHDLTSHATGASKSIGCVAHVPGAIAVVVHDLITAPGGSLHVWERATGDWTETPFPAARAGMTCGGIGDSVFITGGFYSTPGGDELSTVYRYRDGALTDMMVASQEPRAGAAIAACDGYLAVAGGFPSNSTGTGSVAIDLFALTDGEVPYVSFGEPRAGVGAASAGARIVFAGGIEDGQYGSDLTTQGAYVFDCGSGALTPSTMQGIWGPMLPQGAGTSDGTMYFAGTRYQDYKLVSQATLLGAGIAVYGADGAWSTMIPPTVGPSGQVLVGSGYFGFDANDDHLVIAGPIDAVGAHGVDVYDRSAGRWASDVLAPGTTPNAPVLGAWLDGAGAIVVRRSLTDQTIYVETLTP